MNYYGFLKLLADEYLLNMTTKPSQWVGLRFFNVYGPGEQHKGKMASMIYQAYCQFKETGKVKLFKDGTQKRDFIHVDDVVRVIMWMIDHPSVNGIFDVGSGSQMSFIDMAYEVADSMNMKGSVEIKLINMPDSIKDKFQVNTCADLSKLDAVDCYTCTGSIRDYIKWLQDR
jgi:ADP-L-glycero-D-manno-heptose 6-epimerase